MNLECFFFGFEDAVVENLFIFYGRTDE